MVLLSCCKGVLSTKCNPNTYWFIYFSSSSSILNTFKFFSMSNNAIPILYLLYSRILDSVFQNINILSKLEPTYCKTKTIVSVARLNVFVNSSYSFPLLLACLILQRFHVQWSKIDVGYILFHIHKLRTFLSLPLPFYFWKLCSLNDI